MKDLDLQDPNFDFNELGEVEIGGSCKKCQNLKEQLQKHHSMQGKVEELQKATKESLEKANQQILDLRS